MRFIYGGNLLFTLFFLFLELIIRCCSSITIELVDPLIIKINIEKLEIIPIIILLNGTIENRSAQKIRLVKFDVTASYSKEICAIEEEKQDKQNKKKLNLNYIK